MMNIHTIKNKYCEVSVKEVGAELCSFKSLNSNKEYIWQAAPEVWASHAPNLFPIIGCLKDDGFLYKGKEYNCPKHGFFRKNSKVTLLEKSNNSLTYILKFDDETLKIYPFKFEIQLKYILEENKLTLQHTIINHGENEMLFSLGGHPAFNCVLNEGETYKDYYLEFEKPETAETWHVLKDGLIGKETTPVFDEPNCINLHPNIFDDDALVFKNLNSSKVRLKSKKSSQILSVEFNDFPYLGIWAKPNSNYVCIEPWIGIADSVDSDRDFEKKEGLAKVQSKKSYVASYYISIEE